MKLNRGTFNIYMSVLTFGWKNTVRHDLVAIYVKMIEILLIIMN